MGTVLYFIGASFDGPIKIGISNNPEVRLGALQTGNHQELLVLLETERFSVDMALSLETSIHKALEGYRIRGEWFRCHAGLAARALKEHFDAGKQPAAEKPFAPFPGVNPNWHLGFYNHMRDGGPR